MKRNPVRLNSRIFWTSIVLGTLLSSSAFAADTTLQSMSDLSSYVKNPKFKLDQDELRLVGLIPAGCSIHLAKDAKNSGITIQLSGCEKDAAKDCTTDSCTDLGNSKNKIALDIHALNSGVIQFSHEDNHYSVDDEGRFQHENLLGDLEFKNKADRDADRIAAAAEKRTGQIDDLYEKVKIGCKSKDLEEVMTAESALKSLLKIGALVKGKTTFDKLDKGLKAQEAIALLVDLKKRVKDVKFSDDTEWSNLIDDLDKFNLKYDKHADDIADQFAALIEKRLEGLDGTSLDNISTVYGDIESLYKVHALALDGLSSSKKAELQNRAETLEVQRAYYLGFGKASALDPSVKMQWENQYNNQVARINFSLGACGSFQASILVNCSAGSLAAVRTGLDGVNTAITTKQTETDAYIKKVQDANKAGTTTPGTYDPKSFNIKGFTSDLSTNPGYGQYGNNFSGVPTSNLWYGGSNYGG